MKSVRMSVSDAVISHVRCQNVSELAGTGGPVEVGGGHSTGRSRSNVLLASGH